MAQFEFSTDRELKALPKAQRRKRYISWFVTGDHERARRFGVRVTDKGTKTFLVIKRIKGRTAPVTAVLGKYPDLGLAAARKKAEEALALLNDNIVPLELHREQVAKAALSGRDTFKAAAEDFFEDDKFQRNRKAGESKRIFDLYLFPAFGHRQIAQITRREITDHLTLIAKRRYVAQDGRTLGGPVMADRVLAAMRRMMNWHALRDGDFVSPIIKGMARNRPSDLARDRVLLPDEIRALWLALDTMAGETTDSRLASEVFAGVVRTLLLTGQRRQEVAKLRRKEIGTFKWRELTDDKVVVMEMENVWTIPVPRSKNKIANLVPLTGDVLAVIGGMAKVNESDLVFTTNGKTAFSGFSKAKKRLDKAMLAQLHSFAEEARADVKDVTLPGWRLHDLRRTAKTLMSDANVRPDISERVIGHKIKGVAGVYDHSKVLPQKRDALNVLAKVVMGIVHHKTAANVVRLPVRRSKRGADKAN